MLHDYHVIYSVRYYPRFHVTGAGLWTFHPWIRRSASTEFRDNAGSGLNQSQRGYFRKQGVWFNLLRLMCNFFSVDIVCLFSCIALCGARLSFLLGSVLLFHSHMSSSIHCYTIFVIVIHSYKIPLLLWYFAYRGCMYIATVSIEMCLSIDDINKNVG